MNKKIVCDECSHTFKVEKLRKKKLGEYQNELAREIYFNCPKCKLKYYVMTETKTIKAMQARMRRVMKMIRNRQGKGEHEDIESLQGEYEKLKEDLKNEMDMLRIMFGKGESKID